jgi:hypothetical protein
MTANETRLVEALEATDALAMQALPAVRKDGDVQLHNVIQNQLAQNVLLIVEVRAA